MKITGSGDPATAKQGSSLAIIGGLSKSSTLDDAGLWLDAQLAKYGVRIPINKFIKDESFRGRLWARFPTVEDMNAAITMFESKALTQEDSGKVWCSQDLPHHIRTSRTFLVDFKKLLVKWKCNKNAINFTDDTMILSVEKKPIIKVSTQDNQLKLDWLDEEWGHWNELINATEFKELTDKANNALKEAQELRAKGMGKGKPQL